MTTTQVCDVKFAAIHNNLKCVTNVSGISQ